jgi:phage terminase small subunit
MRLKKDGQLTWHHRLFCKYYLLHGNATRAARAAGSTNKAAGQAGWALLQLPQVQAEIARLRANIARELKIEAKQVHEVAAAIALHDATEICQMRHVSCHECWPTWQEEAHIEEWNAMQLADAMGEEYFPEHETQKPEEPDPGCLACRGQGRLDVWFADTRHLEPRERMAFAAASIGKDGYKVDVADRLKALDMCAKLLGLYKSDGDDKTEKVNVYFNGMRFPPEPPPEGKKP